MNYISFNNNRYTKQAFLYKILTDFGVILRIHGEYLLLPDNISQDVELEIKKIASLFDKMIIHQEASYTMHIIGDYKTTVLYRDFYHLVLGFKPIIRINDEGNFLVFPPCVHVDLVKALKGLRGNL